MKADRNNDRSEDSGQERSVSYVETVEASCLPNKRTIPALSIPPSPLDALYKHKTTKFS
jgi:hypothetical protein